MADLKEICRQIFQQTLAAIDIPATMQRKLMCDGSSLRFGETCISLADFDRFFVVAIGKAAHGMVNGLVSVLPSRIQLEGIVAAPTVPVRRISGMNYFVAGHPVPNEESWKVGEAVLALLAQCNTRTLVFFLLSGGGSALVERPIDSRQTLGGVQQLHRTLVTCGAPIQAINTVRKHLSAVKGGRLTVAAGPATKITFAISDVPSGHETALASGPTLPDSTTVADAERVIREYQLREKLPPTLRGWIEEGKMPETPKSDNSAFVNAHFSLLLAMDDLFHPAHYSTEARGFLAVCDNSTDDWPVERAADFLLNQLETLRRENPGERVALIADGEVSSPVTGNGIGGRNSAFVLACVEKIAGRQIAVFSAGTDGIDGNSPAAGAVADGETLARAISLGLDLRESFRQSDAFGFFSRLGDAVITGPTGHNLRDLRILLAEK